MKIKEKIPTEEFAAILKEFKIPEDHFDKGEKTMENEFIIFLINMTREALLAVDQSAEEKAGVKLMIEDILDGVPDVPNSEGVRIYFKMLLALIANEDIAEYKKKIPGELLTIFEKTELEIGK